MNYLKKISKLIKKHTGIKTDNNISSRPPTKAANHSIDITHDIKSVKFGNHRSGWNFVIDSLAPINDPDGIYLTSYLEKEFCWSEPSPVTFPKKWVGITHRPPHIPDWFPQPMKRQFYENEYFQDTLDNSCGIFALSRYHANYLSSILPIEVDTLMHPTEIPEQQWSPAKCLSNELNVVQVGRWLRNQHAIFILPKGKYKKIFLSKLKIEQAASRIFEIEKQHLLKLNTFRNSMYDSAEIIDFLPNDQYDKLLCSCIIFLDLYDSSANNTIIEGIARGTPILVNKLDPVVEYLGSNYPYYYDSYEHARDMLHDKDLIIKTHEYLKSEKLRENISIEKFKHDLINSTLIRDAVL